MSRLNKTESAVLYYTLGLVLLDGLIVVALSISSHDLTQKNRVCCFILYFRAGSVRCRDSCCTFH